MFPSDLTCYFLHIYASDKNEKISSMVKLVSLVITNLCVTIVILYTQWEQNTFLLFAILSLFQDFLHGIILPIIFINNLPNLKNYIVDKINHPIIETNTAILGFSTTIFDSISGYIPRRENQIDVIA